MKSPATNRTKIPMKTAAAKQFEYCKMCRINYDNGRKHNYFHRHVNSLAAFLSRFQTKLSEIRSLVADPMLLNHDLAPRSRFWCVFCDCDIDEVGSDIASCNGIRHLASEEHLKNWKSFIWKYGGGMEQVDSFRIREEELAEWEKRCKALKRKTSSSVNESSGLLTRALNDIQTNYNITSSFEKNSFRIINSNISHDVMPLQCSTNEDYQVYRSDGSQVASADSPFVGVVSSLPSTIHDASISKCNDLAAYGGSQHLNFPYHAASSVIGYANGSAYMDKIKSSGSSSFMGSQNLTQVSAGGTEESGGNVHTGAPLPWLEATEGLNTRSVKSQSKKSRNSGKLNPNRVGAAWAEKQKRELELEKRGEIVASSYDANWLPNFGSVWQSGARKESRKDFEKEA
ncbi:TITAN-like protein [Drosera capensis]